ncbi:hypothetical protein B0H14DRAFT_3441519 [Mycena olivaceomarginata]|nr:hypothetical protein B0H14DRAFT_3441519 [Mycena olivaceomarginata]
MTTRAFHFPSGERNQPYFDETKSATINDAPSPFLYGFAGLILAQGPDQANWAVAPTDPNTRKPINEIKDYERGRYISSMEAATRITGFHISPLSPIPLHTPVDIDAYVDALTARIVTILEAHMPLARPCPYTRCWWNGELSSAV